MKAKDIVEAITSLELNQEHGAAFLLFLVGRVEQSWANCLDEDISALGYLMVESLAINDLTKGIDGFSGERILSQAVSLPPLVYSLLARKVYRTFPQEFQDEIGAIQQTIRKEQKEGST